MTFIEIMIFTIVFMTVLFYLGTQFLNTFKINTYILMIKEDFDIDKSDEYIENIDKLIKNNIVTYVITYIIISLIYFLLTKHNGLLISIFAFGIFFLMYFMYLKSLQGISIELKVKSYKFYNYVNFMLNLGIVLFLNVSYLLVLLY